MRTIPVVVLLHLLFIIGCANRENNTLTLAGAANMQFAMKALVEEFSAANGIKCSLIIGSSGKLTAQIKEGAPYDLFLSADMKYPMELFETGFASSLPEVYGYGRLVLWTMNEGIQPGLEDLLRDEVSHIAVANTITAPYGKEAINVLSNSGFYEDVEHKLIYGESIAQTNQFIASGAAEIGFTAMSVVLSEKMKGKGSWAAIDEKLYDKIEQGLVLIDREKGAKQEAQMFRDFLFSDKGRETLERFGYIPEENVVKKPEGSV